MSAKTFITAVSLSILASLLVLVCFWQAGRLLPNWIQWNETKAYCDLDDDGALEYLELRGRMLSISELQTNENPAQDATPMSAYTLHTLTPKDWIISDVHIANIDDEGEPEIVVLAWRKSNFGSSHPFWLPKKDYRFTQHVFIFNYTHEGITPRWMSSDIGAEVTSLTIDAEGMLHLTTRTGHESSWKWEHFGIHQVFETYPKAHVRFVAVGDNLAHDTVNDECFNPQTSTFNYQPLYEYIKPFIAAHDMAAVQQETIFVQDEAQRSSYPRFGTPTAMGDALVDAGFRIVCSASNHSLDKGAQGVEETLDYWNNTHPEVCVLGLHTTQTRSILPYIYEEKGISFTLFNAAYGINDGLNCPTPQEYVDLIGNAEELVSNVQSAENLTDFTICFLHIGEEYASKPSKEQKQVVERLVEAGADCVICTHTHVVQGAQKLIAQNGNEALVFWGLGNFMSHQTEERTVLGGIAEVDFYLDSEGNPYIGQWQLKPSVCHFEGDTTRVMLLENYSPDLTQRHFLTRCGKNITVEGLWQQWQHVSRTS